MAFCSECGKSNVDQATVCDGCGKPIRVVAKAAAPARFKGTMIMGAAVPKPAASPVAAAPTPAPTPVATPASAAPAAAPAQPNLAFQATMMGPMTAPGASAPPPAGASAPPAAIPATAAAPKVSPKGTMIGGMGGMPGAIQAPGTPQSGAASNLAPVPAASPELAAPSASPFGGASIDPGQQPASPALEINYGGYGGAPSKGNKTWLWVALGIVGALGFACVGTGLALYFGAVSFGDKVGDAMNDIARRAQVTTTLSAIHTACASGDCNQAADLFHPAARERLLPQASTVTPAVITVFGDIQASEAVSLVDSGDEEAATSLDIDPASCIRLTGRGAKVIGCSVAEGVAQIVAMENLAALR